MRYVVGVDAGGTASRALAVAADGTPVGRGRSGGANPNSHPPEVAVGHIVEAITDAVAGLDRGGSAACVVGMAGSSKLGDPRTAAVFEHAFGSLGFPCRVRVISDAEAAFASATSSPDGTVLIAGTGSIAARVRRRRTVSTAGGYGWLLGDEGSGFWIGREAVRHALRELSAGGEPGALTRAVLAEAFDGPSEVDGLRTAHRLITATNGEPPIRMARYAPIVTGRLDAGDADAAPIVDAAADHLVRTALAARDEGEDTPLVLVGSLLDKENPVGVRVRHGLGELDVHTSCDGVSGAAWLAAVDAYGDHAPRPAQG